MSEPTAAGFDLWEILKWMGAGIMALLSWVIKGHHDDIAKLKADAQWKVDADKQRSELREDIADTRESIAKLSDKMDTQNTRIFERLDFIVDHMNGNSKR